MRPVHQPDLLADMKNNLRDLENIRLLGPNDLEILTLRRYLRARIAELEKTQNSIKDVAAD